jgi:hypothetical protein
MKQMHEMRREIEFFFPQRSSRLDFSLLRHSGFYVLSGNSLILMNRSIYIFYFWCLQFTCEINAFFSSWKNSHNNFWRLLMPFRTNQKTISNFYYLAHLSTVFFIFFCYDLPLLILRCRVVDFSFFFARNPYYFFVCICVWPFFKQSSIPDKDSCL